MAKNKLSKHSKVSKTKSTVNTDSPKIKTKAEAKVTKVSHKRKTKGASELDNPKYATKDTMLALIDFAAEKEDKKVKEKLAKRVAVAKIIEEKKMKRDERKGAKEDKIEQIKKDYLHNQKQKKTDAKKQKRTNKAESEKPSAPKKRVRFA